MRDVLLVGPLMIFILVFLSGCAEGEWFPKGPATIKPPQVAKKSDFASGPHGGAGQRGRYKREPYGPKR